MEYFDSEMAKRVWQRVQTTAVPMPEPEIAPELQELLRREEENAAVYLRLSRRMTGRERAALQQMAQQEQAHCRFLMALQGRRWQKPRRRR